MNIRFVQASAAIGLLALSSCSLVSEEPSNDSASYGPIIITACSEVHDASADSTVAAANQMLQASLKDMGNAMNDGTWSDMQASAPKAATEAYQSVLAKYPGHCGAQFGQAIATLANLVTNPELDEIVDSLNPGDSSSESYDSYLDEASLERPMALIKLAQATNSAEPLTVERVQAVGVKLLPSVDSAIAMLNNVMAQADFMAEFDITRDDGSIKRIQADKGEVGPGLAMLKYIKAMLLTMVAVQAEVALNGNYDWIETLDGIENSSFDHLTASQTEALDHLVSLTQKNSPFLTIREEFQDAFAGIPALLESAIVDLQNGLQYGVDEAAKGWPGTQENDIYVVGNWADADLDPADLTQAIGDLERTKKYLKGEVTVTWSNGAFSLVVDVPKFFQITDGYQDYLPYHKVLPYSQWNDTLSADTTWDTYLAFYREPMESIFASKVSMAVFGTPQKIFSTSYLYATDESAVSLGVSLATENPGGSADAYEFEFENGRIAYIGHAGSCTLHVVLPPEITVQKVTLDQACRMNTYGQAEFINNINAVIRGPFQFTDADGKPTFGEKQFEEIDNLYETHGWIGFSNKIIFPDPTFGGVFPKLTQASIWTTLASLNNIHARSACKVGNETVTYVDGYSYEIESYCDSYGEKVMPENPSDLDVLHYYFN